MQKARLVNKPKDKYPSLSNGEIFLIELSESTYKTHVYFYDTSGSFKGCFPIKWFETISEIQHPKKNRRESLINFEQLSLF